MQNKKNILTNYVRVTGHSFAIRRNIRSMVYTKIYTDKKEKKIHPGQENNELNTFLIILH